MYYTKALYFPDLLIGLTVGGAIFTNKITGYLPEFIAANSIAAGATPAQVPSIIGFLLGPAGSVPAPDVSPAVLQAAVLGLRQAYAKSFSYIYYEIIPWAAAAFILLCFLKPTAQSMTWSITTPSETYEQLGVHRAVSLNQAQQAHRAEQLDEPEKGL